MKNDRLFVAITAVAMQMAVVAAEFPETYGATLSVKDSSTTYSLTTGFEGHNWKDANGNAVDPISEASIGKNYRIESGARALASPEIQEILPNIYCFGQIVCTKTTTFKNLYLCENAEYYRKNDGVLKGNITVLSEDADKPAKIIYYDTSVWGDTFKIAAKVVGSKDSHLLYQMANGGKGWLHFWEGGRIGRNFMELCILKTVPPSQIVKVYRSIFQVPYGSAEDAIYA